MRLYVGGLVETISEEDLRRLFSPYGNIFSVDIRRTNANDANSPCKGFAFMNIQPFGDIQILFGSQFTFRGSDLKLELAKEDYMAIWRKRKQQEIAETELEREESQNDENEMYTVAEKTRLIYWIERDPKKRRVRFTYRKPLEYNQLNFTFEESEKKDTEKPKSTSIDVPTIATPQDSQDSVESTDLMREDRETPSQPSSTLSFTTPNLFTGPSNFKLDLDLIVPDVPLPSEAPTSQEQPKTTKLTQKKDKRDELFNVLYENRGLFDLFLNIKDTRCKQTDMVIIYQLMDHFHRSETMDELEDQLTQQREALQSNWKKKRHRDIKRNVEKTENQIL